MSVRLGRKSVCLYLSQLVAKSGDPTICLHHSPEMAMRDAVAVPQNESVAGGKNGLMDVGAMDPPRKENSRGVDDGQLAAAEIEVPSREDG